MTRIAHPSPRLDCKPQAPTPEATHNFPDLDQITTPTVTTTAAAYYLNRRPQTLRCWACMENGPARPIRVNGRLAWPVADIRALLGVSK